MMKCLKILLASAFIFTCILSIKIPSQSVKKQLYQLSAVCATTLFIQAALPMAAFGGMLTFPLPVPLKNNIVLVSAYCCCTGISSGVTHFACSMTAVAYISICLSFHFRHLKE